MARVKPKKTIARQRDKGVTRRPDEPSSKRPSRIETALAALAHEVRTPLTGILALGELLSASDLPERERGWAAAIKSAAEHLAQLTSVVVDGVKVDGGNLILREEAFSPRAIAEAIAASLSARAEAKGLHCEVVIGPLPELTIGDPIRLRAALENLIDNAVKFTDRGQVALTILCERDPAARGRMRLIFAVEDNGVGLSPVEIKQLFRPFHQASDAIARRFGGAGLGLAFVQRVAKAMGGDLTVESTPESGSIFRLDAVVALHRAKGRSVARRPAHPAAVGLRILCAEDNPYSRVVLRTILSELGHNVDFVGTGEAALAATQQGGYDVVLMDITLPGFGGVEATRRIRALPGALGRLPIIGITGRAERDQEASARAAGMNDYLLKPVSPSALAAALEKFER